MQGYDGCLLFTWANGEKYSGLVITNFPSNVVVNRPQGGNR